MSRAKIRTPLLAVSEVIDKGNRVVFDGSGSFILPGTCAGANYVRRAATGVQERLPLHAKNGVFVLFTGGFQSAGSASKGPSARPSKPGPPFLWRKQG